MVTTDRRLVSPAFRRNRGPILGVLEGVFGGVEGGEILELASGPGQHVCHFAEALPRVRWQPTERDPELLASIEAWRRSLGVENVLPPVELDVDGEAWPVEGPFVGAVAINFLHMVGTATVRRALAGVAERLVEGGRLVVYDCFTYDGAHVSESNVRFDEHLRATSPGRVHEFGDVARWAAEVGLTEPETHELPANNVCVVWVRR